MTLTPQCEQQSRSVVDFQPLREITCPSQKLLDELSLQLLALFAPLSCLEQRPSPQGIQKQILSFSFHIDEHLEAFLRILHDLALISREPRLQVARHLSI